jgi:hypothetical protein
MAHLECGVFFMFDRKHSSEKVMEPGTFYLCIRCSRITRPQVETVCVNSYLKLKTFE